MIKFENRSTLGRGSYVAVTKLVTLPPNHPRYRKGHDNSFYVVVGRIEQSPLGYFHYFEPEKNELNPSFRDDDIEALKVKVEQHLSKP